MKKKPKHTKTVQNNPKKKIKNPDREDTQKTCSQNVAKRGKS